MADSRELTYGIGFSAGDAASEIDKLQQGLGGVDSAAEQAEIGAQNLSQAMDSMGAAGVGAAHQAGAAAVDMGERFEDAGDDIGKKFRNMGASAETFGAAFKQTMAEGIKDGQSLARSFQTGITGALSFTQSKFKGFRNNLTVGAKAIGKAFTHPVQTIKTALVKSFTGAGKAAKDAGDEMEDAAHKAQDFGREGTDAGRKVKEAISGALKTFLGVAAIVAATKAIKNFAQAAIGAAAATENTAAKFDRLFQGTDALEWAKSYGAAVHRSTDEVKSFMVGNEAMYTALGVTGKAATDLSKITTSLAYDFGNAFRMDDAQALSVLQEGIKGNAEALAEYGINLDDATIKAEALKVGITSNINELDDATLAQLRLNALLDQSANIQQAAITQTDGLVNSSKSLKGIWADFMASAGAKFTPVLENFFGVILDAWPRIEPMLMGLVDMLSDGLSQALPIITDLGMVLIPVLTDVLGTVFKAALPLIQVFGNLAQVVLPPLASIIGLLVENLMPPIVGILDVIVSLVEPLMPVLQSIAEALLPPIAQLLGIISPILEALAPVLEVIGTVLKVIGEALGKVIGWVANGVGAVVNFFSGLFGGAKKSKTEVEGLNGAVNGLADTTSKETSLALDTSDYAAGIKGAADANKVAQDSIVETKDITDINLQTMGIEATSTYATMAIDAETAWTRMTTAAENGAAAIVSAFQRIASAAKGVSSANVNVSVNLPGHAGGTDSFEGGWTKINERGGEVAFLPSGSAIIPADKSDRLIQNSTSNQSVTTMAPPQIQITIQGNADQATTDDMVGKLEAMFKRLYRQAQEDEFTTMSIKNAYV